MAIDVYSAPNTTRTPDGKVPLGWLTPSQLNPRKRFDEGALAELTESLRVHGMLEPIVVREIPPRQVAAQLKTLEIVCGERRYRAAILADLPTVPIHNLGPIDDSTALQLALIENLQRADLDPIEEAEGFRQLNQVVGLKQSQIAEAVHRSQPSIANRMRLLKLPDDVQERIRKGELTAAHGVALAKFDEFPKVASALAELTVRQKWTSARTEADPDWSVNGDLVKKGAMVEVGYRDTFADTVCRKACPFGAYRNWPAGHWCLKPEHHAELSAQANVTKEAQLAQLIAEAEANGRKIVKLAELAYEAYERPTSWNAPKACTEACPCRALGVGRDGDAGPVCLDPQRFKKLQRDETKAQHAPENARKAEGKQAALAAVDQLAEPTSCELALFLAHLFTGYGVRDHVAPSLRRWAPGVTVDLGEKYSTPELFPIAETLATLPATALVKIGVEALLRHAAQRDELGNGWAKWYLDRKIPAVAEADAEASGG